MTDKDKQLEALATQRWRIALQLTLAMIAIYFGFICWWPTPKEPWATSWCRG